MKTLKIILGVGMSLLTLNATELKVTVENIDISRGGNLIVMVFQKDGFPKEHDKAILKEVKKVDGNSMTFNFETTLDALAVKVLHDEDENGKTTKNWTGIIPKEGLGFTNEQTIWKTLSVPKYEKCKVSKEIYENGITIKLVY